MAKAIEIKAYGFNGRIFVRASRLRFTVLVDHWSLLSGDPNKGDMVAASEPAEIDLPSLDGLLSEGALEDFKLSERGRRIASDALDRHGLALSSGLGEAIADKGEGEFSSIKRIFARHVHVDPDLDIYYPEGRTGA